MKINYIKNFSIKLKPVRSWQERQKKNSQLDCKQDLLSEYRQ